MALRQQTVAVTGAAGMVGRHVVAALNKSEFSCLPIGRQQWDLRNWKNVAELDEIFGTSSSVVHAGAIVPVSGQTVSSGDLFDANIRASLCLGEWCAARDRSLVLISGATVYASPFAIGIKETAPLTTRPLSGLYGLTKLLAEQVLGPSIAAGLRLAVLRPSSVYGAGIPSSRMIGSLLARAAKGDDIELMPPIDEKINLLHAADLADAVVRVLEAGAWDTFNVAAAEASSVADIARACVSVVGKGRVISPPDGRGQPTTRYQLDCSKAAATFHFRQNICLVEGLRRTWLNEF
jgi:UDP-glucose 4-epimerase